MPFKSRRKADPTFHPQKGLRKRKLKPLVPRKKKTKIQKKNKLDSDDERLAAEGIYSSPNFVYFDAKGKPINM